MSLSEEKQIKQKIRKDIPIHILVIHFSLIAIIALCIASTKHLLHRKALDTTIEQIQEVTKNSVNSIGVQSIQNLKDSRKHMGMTYFQHSASIMKDKLIAVYKNNKLASPPVIYARSDNHEEFMYILSSGHLKSNPMDIYRIDAHVKDVYTTKQIISEIKKIRKNGIQRPTVLSVAPFIDKYGQVYGVLTMEFDIKNEMEAINKSSKVIYGTGGAVYLTLALFSSFIFRSNKENNLGKNIKNAS